MAEAKNKFEFSKLNTLAVVSLASAVTLFGAPAAVLTGHVSLAQIKETDAKGRWMAITGLVLGYASIALAVLFTVVGIVVRVKHGVDFDHGNDWNDRFGNDDFRPQPFQTYPMPQPTDTIVPMPGTN